MSTILGSDISARIITVLEDYLPAELDLIDIQRGGSATANISAYYAGSRPVVPIYPSITVDVQRWEITEARPVSLDTGRLGYDAHALVGVHVQTVGEDVNRMRDLAERYMAGVVRVLVIRKDGLETALDNTRMSGSCEGVRMDGDAVVIDEGQGSGAMIRSVKIPLVVWMIEGL